MKTLIGRLVTPSGNGCDVHMVEDDMERNIGHELWDKDPPSREDLLFYKETVLPIFSNKALMFLKVTTT